MPYKRNPKYLVSNLGNVKSFHGGHNKWVNKTQGYDKDGYRRMNYVNPDGSETTMRVHRMVAETFIPNPVGSPVVNHKNNIKDDNDASNLEWVNISYNTKYGYEVGGVISASSKFIKASIDGEVFSYYQSCAKCSKAWGTGRGRIEKDLIEGNFCEIVKLEHVNEIPENAPIDKKLTNKDINFRYLNPYKIIYNNGETEYFENIKDYAARHNISHSSAQLVLVDQTTPSKARNNIKEIHKISKGEYIKLYINK